MSSRTVPERPRGLALMFNWRRVRFVIGVATIVAILFNFTWTSGFWSLLSRTVLLGLISMTVFGVFEQWPRRLPRWLARWVLQVVAVALTIPPSVAIVYALSTAADSPPFFTVEKRMAGFGTLVGLGMFIAPWVALGALVRQKETLARNQALAFDLERSELERRALDARLNLLQGQVAPHFLFNTLANIQVLVETGSPQASAVLRSLIAYLRAAVPRLNETSTTLGQELELVQAYLELMHMRMPDRLLFTLHVDEEARNLQCPPMTLLTLVENAVRHGIDPSEEGGRIDITAQRRGDRCVVRVSDTGAGLRPSVGGLGTGLTTLRERLELAFGGDAQLRVSSQQPRGVSAEIEFPAALGARA